MLGDLLHVHETKMHNSDQRTLQLNVVSQNKAANDGTGHELDAI
jgi:hypothetical protein